MKSEQLSYWSVFRPVFVIFSLYLMGDAFSRWDGFRYYATFSEFIPAFALVSILWTITAAITAILVLIFTRSIEWTSSLAGKRLRAEHLLLFICYLVVIGEIAWFAKRIILGGGSTLIMKAAFLFFVLIVSACITWLSRNHFNNIQARITPLVFLFGFLILVSFPIVIYSTWLEKPEKAVTQALSQSYSEEKPRSNVILVTFDALTSLDMSAYGYYRETTPFIKEWAKKATLFERAYTAGTTTGTTTASLMSGKNLWSHYRYNQVHVGRLHKGNVENIAYELKKAGYYNYAIMTNANASVSGMGIDGSFYYNVPWAELYEPTNVSESIRKWLYGMFGEKIRLYEWLVMPDFALDNLLNKIPVKLSELEYPPDTVIQRVSTVLDNKLREPYFMWIHFHPPHWPYTPPKEFKGIYDDSSTMIKRKDQGRFFYKYHKKQLDSESINKSLKILRARYDEHVRYCDKVFENVIDLFSSRDQLKNSTMILSSDHGESFRNGNIEHGSVIYEQVIRIPLIIKEPGQSIGRTIEMPVHQSDISATILDLADIPRPEWIQGRSLIPLMHGGELPQVPLFSMWLSPNVVGQKITKGRIATWDGDYKLIYDVEKDKSLLFNLKKDPGEMDNLVEREPEIGKHLLDLIQTNLTKANEKIIKSKNGN